jgi:hypothetical protein
MENKSTQYFMAQFSESINCQRFIDDWQQESGNNGFGNPPVDFQWGESGEMIVRTFGWDEASLKRTISIAVHRSDPKCQIIWM